MDSGSQESRPPSTQLGALSIKLLVKTILRAVLWLGLASLTTYFYPAATWAWYAALGLVLIGILFSLYVLIVAVFAKRQESLAAQQDGS